jgi:hypothetical protein
MSLLRVQQALRARTRLLSTMPSVKYLSQTESQQIDEELMSDKGAFSLDQVNADWDPVS